MLAVIVLHAFLVKCMLNQRILRQNVRQRHQRPTAWKGSHRYIELCQMGAWKGSHRYI